MKQLNPYLRYINRTTGIKNKQYTRTYDCRLLYVLSGGGKMLTEGRELTLGPGTLLYYPAGISYLLVADKETNISFYTVNFDFVDGYPQEGVMPPACLADYDEARLCPSQTELGRELFLTAFCAEGSDNLRWYLSRLHELHIAREDNSLISAVLAALIEEICHLDNRSKTNNRTVEDALGYMKLHFAEPLTNSDIASALGYHPYYLGALFRKELGKTPRQRLDEIRLRHAEILLSEGEMTIYEIAEACGFKTPEHFTKRFKNSHGATPTEYRRHLRLV